MSKPLLFCDFDGVLCHDRFWRSLPPEQYSAVQAALFAGPHAPSTVNDWMKGLYTSEEINALLADKIGVDYHTLWRIFVQDCETMHVRADVLAEIDRLRARYVTILATGNMDCFNRFTVPALGLASHFDVISNSCNEGLFKTDNGGALFLRYARAYDVPMASCIVLDDSAEVCAVAENLGGRAFLVTPEHALLYHLRQIR